jgi:methionine aminopeptidase
LLNKSKDLLDHAVKFNMYLKSKAFLVKEFSGHYVGEKMHELPSISLSPVQTSKIDWLPDKTFTLEPIIVFIKYKILEEDKWSITIDQETYMFEHTIYFSNGIFEILTPNIFDIREKLLLDFILY